jgi:hypothetical protein
MISAPFLFRVSPISAKQHSGIHETKDSHTLPILKAQVFTSCGYFSSVRGEVLFLQKRIWCSCAFVLSSFDNIFVQYDTLANTPESMESL